MLNVNFVKTENEETRKNFALAIIYSANDMGIQLANEELKKIEKKLSAEDISIKQKDALEEEKNIVLKSITAMESTMNDTESAFIKVVENMTDAGNDEDVVIRVLRLIAAGNNQKLIKFAVSGIQDETLYNAMETIHIMKKVNEDGMSIPDNLRGMTYKTARIRLETIIRERFSLSFESDYTDKIRVKPNAEDIALIHDCYVTGFKNSFKKDKDGNYDFTGREINTLVKIRENKKTGEKTYNYEKLMVVIAKIVIKHYCK